MRDYRLLCPNGRCRDESGNRCFACACGNSGRAFLEACGGGGTVRNGALAAGYKAWNRSSLYGRLAAVICPEKHMLEMVRHNPRLKEKAAVMHDFAPDAKPIPEWKRSGYIFYAGPLTYEAGMDIVLTAANEHPELAFVLAGRGNYEKRFRSLKNVTVANDLSLNEMTDAVRMASVFIDTSLYDDGSHSFLALSQQCGTPAVASAVASNKEHVRNGRTGELFEPGNIDDFILKLTGLMRERMKREDYVRGCLSVRHPDADRYCRVLESFYSGGYEPDREVIL